jgi:hypothetical protein
VVAKVRERLAVNKQRSHRFHMERSSLKKLNDLDGKEQFRVEVSNRFAALEDLDTKVEINSAWEMIRENIKILSKESVGYFELRKHKPWFDEGCSKLLDRWGEVSMCGYLPHIINRSLVDLHCTLFCPGNRTGHKGSRALNAA